MIPFENLHTHTQWSKLDGLSTIRELAEVAVEYDQTSLAITDHGTIAGIPKLFRTAKEYGLKPIAGLEAYYTPDLAAVASLTDKKEQRKAYYHMTLLAQNLKGYQNLCKLVTFSNAEGFYYRPRIDLDHLALYSEGIICLSGCMGGYIPKMLLQGQVENAIGSIHDMLDIFGDKFYLEYMYSHIEDQKKINAELTVMGKKFNIKGVCTGDSHYTHKEDEKAHEALLCVGTRGLLSDPKRFKIPGSGYYYKTVEDMRRHFGSSLLETSRTIADRCSSYEIPSNGSMPRFPKERMEGKTAKSYLEKLAWEGLRKRKEMGSIYRERLNHELKIVYKLGYEDYFIIVYDFLKHARQMGIYVGPGRGSSAGSLLAYCLYITEIDPIITQLYFERFLNEHRQNPPDIDVDISDTGRERVLDYIKGKYGKDNVAYIGSYSTLGPRAAIEDTAKVHGVSIETIRHYMKQIPRDPNLKWDDVVNLGWPIKIFGQKVMDIAGKLHGKIRHSTKHAAGIIISPTSLVEELPLVMKDGFYGTVYRDKELEKMGYVKFDVLGLKTLGLIDRCIKNIPLSLSEQKLMKKTDDEKVYQTLCDGKTTGVFQLEGWGYTKMVVQYKPRNFEDMMMINALYRPGPMQGGEGLDKILRRRFGKEQITYIHPRLESVLGYTYGLPVFQEQVMSMCGEMAGFTLPESDLMRRAIGKKDEAAMASYQQKFMDGCKRLGHNAVAGSLWQQITFFNRYGWNRAHAAAYGLVTYMTAWLKTHHSEQFMCELLNMNKGDNARQLKLIDTAIRENIKFKKVDINESKHDYTVPHNIKEPWRKEVLCGLASLKGIGTQAAIGIIQERNKTGKFYDRVAVRARLPGKILNKTMYQILDDAGAFDELQEVDNTEVPF